MKNLNPCWQQQTTTCALRGICGTRGGLSRMRRLPEVTLTRWSGSFAPRSTCDRDGMSPAHHAAREGHGAVLRILVDAGANVDTTAALGNFTPTHDAARKGHIQALKVLVDAGADVNTPGGPHDCTPAGSAAFAGHTRVLEILRRAGADLDTAWPTRRAVAPPRSS